MRRWVTILVSAALLFGSTAASAAVPPLKTAKQRQQALRKEASKAKLDITVTVTAGSLASYAKSGVGLGGSKGLKLPATRGEASLALGADGALPWKVVYALLTTKEPITALQEHVGKIDTSRTRIETLDGHFVYVWGDSPQVAMSRDLARIRRITAKSGEHTWEFRLSGELGVAGLPERIHVLRSGEPYANVELGLSQSVSP